MTQYVVGIENLAKRIIVKSIITVNVGGQDWLVVTRADGMIMGVNPDGNIYWTANSPGAWETCRREDQLLYYKYGVISVGDGYLE